MSTDSEEFKEDDDSMLEEEEFSIDAEDMMATFLLSIEGVPNFTLKVGSEGEVCKLIILASNEKYQVEMTLEELEKQDIRYEMYDSID